MSLEHSQKRQNTKTQDKKTLFLKPLGAALAGCGLSADLNVGVRSAGDEGQEERGQS